MGILILYNCGRGKERMGRYGTSLQQTNILPVISSYINFLSFVFLKVYFRNKLHGVPGRAALPQQFIPTICGVPEASRMFCHLTQNPEAFHVFLPIFIHTMSVSNTENLKKQNIYLKDAQDSKFSHNIMAKRKDQRLQ